MTLGRGILSSSHVSNSPLVPETELEARRPSTRGTAAADFLITLDEVTSEAANEVRNFLQVPHLAP